MDRSKKDDYFDILYGGEAYIKHYTKNPRLKFNAYGNNDFKHKLFLNHLTEKKGKEWRGPVDPYSKNDDGADYLHKLTTNYDPSMVLPTMNSARYKSLLEWPFEKNKNHYPESINEAGRGYNTYSSIEESESSDYVTINNEPEGENTEDNDDNPIIHFITQTSVYDKLERITGYKHSNFNDNSNLNNDWGRTSTDGYDFSPTTDGYDYSPTTDIYVSPSIYSTFYSHKTTKDSTLQKRTNSTTKNFTISTDMTTENFKESTDTSTEKSLYTDTTFLKTDRWPPENSKSISTTDNSPTVKSPSDRCFGNLRLDQELCSRDEEVKFVRIFIRNRIDQSCIGVITCLPQKYKMDKDCYTQCLGLRFPEDNGGQTYNGLKNTQLAVLITCICLILLLPILYLFVFIIVVSRID
ncbi:unnamed protein product [Gordionus sp. m RMFG-2023]